jgi:UPF0755 protein
MSRGDVVEDWKTDPWDDVSVVVPDALEPIPRRRRRVLPSLLAVCCGVVVVAILAAGAMGFWFLRQINPSGAPGQPTNFTVKADDTIETVSRRLERNGFVVDAAVFRWYVARQGGLTPEPGFYTLRPRDHMGNLMRVLSTPPNETYVRATFPEGYTVAQMAERLDETLRSVDAERFVELATDGSIPSLYQKPGGTNLEGLLFPDTYFVAADETEASVIQRMVALMERVGRQEGLDQVATTGPLPSPYDVLTVASMIEREARVPGDRPLIARVIYNRLATGFPLQIDATLYYDGSTDTPFDVLRRRPSPYNTYLNPGLPPTPIANPGRASIRAALNPAPNPSVNDPLCSELQSGQPCAYLFYVLADADGSHAFAVTYEQHLVNVARAQAEGLL